VSATAAGLGTAAWTVGIDRGTLRRWRWRRDQGRPLARRRGPRPLPIPDEARTQAENLVRELHGVVGAEALRRSCCGLTRRAAARIKRETLTAMERERCNESARVLVSVPGVMRGFDSMDLRNAGRLLVSADGCLPYRTSWTLVPCYDGPSVARSLEGDFALNGAPLVMRFDRARQHDVPAVRDVLCAYGVLALHGPPRYPQYYGQLERLNRDHRAWLRGGASGDIDRMMTSLNSSWRRRRLGWRTAGEAWNARPELHVDRTQLRTEVELKCEHLVGHDGLTRDLAWRLAVEQALAAHGLLRVVTEAGAR
jgi:hypothetical protein